jgi:hypothetical protein
LSAREAGAEICGLETVGFDSFGLFGLPDIGSTALAEAARKAPATAAPISVNLRFVMTQLLN